MESQLPSHIHYFPVGAARIREIQAIENKLAQCEHGARAFQKLPRNMQRRALSSNPQRLPHRLREKNRREIGSNLKINKRPCRKYRRRPSNLLAEYNRRQRNEIWLETHIWHAKRFHMIKCWGYNLPKRPTNKSYRATLRAATESCLLQDVSYECCFELEGAYEELLAAFQQILSLEDYGLLMDVKHREINWISVFLHSPKREPFDAIGDAKLMWLPQHYNNDALRRIWMWVHPSIYEDVLSSFIQIFGLLLELPSETSNIEKELELENKNNVLQSKIATKNVPYSKTTKYTSKLSNFFKLVVLKDTLNKFRLTGPLCHSVLSKVLTPSVVTPNNNNEDKVPVLPTDRSQETKLDDWWISYYSNNKSIKSNEYQTLLWKSFSSVSPTFKRAVSLVVRDPRLVLPTRKEPLQDVQQFIGSETIPSFCEAFDMHPIFDSTIRDRVTFSMKPTHLINDMRSKLLVPGTPFPLTEEESRIPVLLMYRPAFHASGIGSGWDLVLPCGWGSQMWVTLIMNGAVAGGQDQENTIQGEFLTPPLPHQFPDTKAGRLCFNKIIKEKEEEYFKRPPNCRFNYLKLGVQYPFGVDWMKLVQSWIINCENFHVLRDRKILKILSVKSCKKLDKIYNRQKDCKRKLEEITNSPKKHFKLESQIDSNQPPICEKTEIPMASIKDCEYVLQGLKDNTLIYVRLILIGKGSLEPSAMICLPTEEDLDSLTHENGTVNTHNFEIMELIHSDNNTEKRQTLKDEHKKNLNKLRRYRKHARSEVLCGEEDPLKVHSTIKDALNHAMKEVHDNNKKLIQATTLFASRMNELWLKPQEDQNFQSCSRKIFGYITHGGFCLRMGRSGGLGFVVSNPLKDLMSKLHLLPSFIIETSNSGQVADTDSEFNEDGTELNTDKKEQEQNSFKLTSNNFKEWKQIFVLTRNPSSLHYRWARLLVLNV